MAQEGGKQQNTAYGVFVQACWAQHKRQYPDELIHKEIEEFNKQCSVWWYNLSEQERERFQEMADRSNAQQALQQSYTTHVNNANTIHTNSSLVQNAVSSTSAGGIPSFGSSFTYSDYGIQGAGGQVVNAVVDQTGTVLNYSTNSAPGQMVQQRTVMGQVQHRPGQQVVQQPGKGGKPMKDPNAPKKPLSAYFLFSQEERLKVKAEFPDYSITEVAKELGRRWAQIDPAIKQSYEQRYQESRRQYEQALQAYKPQKKKKDPNAPKQPLSAYFLFSQEERLKVKAEHPNYSICEIAKELGRRWADMNPEVKQHYQQKAEEGRQKYDQEMAAYRQDNRFEDPKPKRDPTMPKQPLSSYFLFSQEERLKVKAENPSYSICECAKELGRRWAVVSPEAKQRFQQMAEQARQKYDQDMAAHRQANPTPPAVAQNANQNTAPTSKLPGTTVPQPGGPGYAALTGSDYGSFLLQ
jgi:IS30 family transposase